MTTLFLLVGRVLNGVVDLFDLFKTKTLRTKFRVAGNLAYPVAACLLVGEPVFVSLMLALGLASAYWHLTQTPLGINLDVGMIFVILLFLTGTTFGVSPIVAVLPAILGGVTFRMSLLFKSLNMETKVGILIGPLLVFGFLSGAALLTATIVLMLALMIRQWVDHGLWHPVSAVGLSLMAVALAL